MTIPGAQVRVRGKTTTAPGTRRSSIFRARASASGSGRAVKIAKTLGRSESFVQRCGKIYAVAQ